MYRLFFIFLSLIFTVGFAEALTGQITIPDDLKQMMFNSSCKQYRASSCREIPKFLKTQKELCDIVRTSNKCGEFEKANPQDSWKYIQCNYEQMCFQNNLEAKDGLAACIVGGTAMAVEGAKFALQIAQGALERAEKTNEMMRACDQSFECKKKLAAGSPWGQAQPDEVLHRKGMAFQLRSFKLKHDADRVQLMIRKQISVEQYYKEIGFEPKIQKSIPQLTPARAITLSSMWSAVIDQIESDSREVRCYIPAERERLKCQIFSDVLSGVSLEKALASRAVQAGKTSFAKGAIKEASQETVQELERRQAAQWVHIADSSQPKKALVQTFAQRNLTTKQENEEWLKFISKPTASQRSLTIENSILKQMNDKMFKDEEYVTALTNAYKEMQFNKLKILEKELQKKHPGFKFHTFSDYKTLKMAYDEIPGLDLTAQLKKITDETNKEFANYAVKNELVRASDEPLTWFKASVGRTDDMSNLAAKYARNVKSNSMFVDGVNDPGFKKWVQTEFAEGQKIRTEVMQSLKDTGMLTSQNLNEANLNRDVMEILRKNRGDPEKARALIESRYGLEKMPEKTFNNMSDFFEKSNSFSPGLRNTERTFATLSDAPHGGLSIDMIGLGADHIQLTSAQAFASARNVDEFLVIARKNEEMLTNEIEGRKKEIKEKVKAATGDPNAIVNCSGDGCKAYLSNRALTDSEVKKITDSLTQNGEQGRLRFSDVRNGNKEILDVIAKQGEDLEKDLRTQLNGKIDTRRLDGLNFAVLIKAKKPGEGTASLHISPAAGLKLTPQERKIIEEAYQKTLRQSNMGYK